MTGRNSAAVICRGTGRVRISYSDLWEYAGWKHDDTPACGDVCLYAVRARIHTWSDDLNSEIVNEPLRRHQAELRSPIMIPHDEHLISERATRSYHGSWKSHTFGGCASNNAFTKCDKPAQKACGRSLRCCMTSGKLYLLARRAFAQGRLLLRHEVTQRREAPHEVLPVAL
jgi:hypothetical protein